MPSPRRRPRHRRERPDLSYLPQILQVLWSGKAPPGPCTSEADFDAIVSAYFFNSDPDGNAPPASAVVFAGAHPHERAWGLWMDAWRAERTLPRRVVAPIEDRTALPTPKGATTDTA